MLLSINFNFNSKAITIYISERRSKLNIVLNERKKSLEEKTLEALENIKFVKLNATESHETEKYTNLVRQCQVSNLKMKFYIKIEKNHEFLNLEVFF